ncbi:hypothetical protein MRX96_042251 [Rhipicephalus microplus]
MVQLPLATAFMVTKKKYRERVASAGCSGCDVLLGLSGGAFRRLCWLLAVSLLVGLTLREWARVFGEYHQYGVFTSVHYGTQTSLPFPDVTVCNVNPIRRSALCKDPRLARREAVPDRVWWRECDEPAAYYEAVPEAPVLAIRQLLLPQLSWAGAAQRLHLQLPHRFGTERRADAGADSVFAQPRYITYIGLIQRRRAALPEPYQPPCRDTWPSRLKYYLQNTTRYTREWNRVLNSFCGINGMCLGRLLLHVLQHARRRPPGDVVVLQVML